MSDRDEVISHAANLKDAGKPAGVRLDIPDHLQSDFKVLIKYGNDAKNHYGKEVKHSVRFSEEDLGLFLHLGLPSGKWIWVSPDEACEVGKFRKQRSLSSMRQALSSRASVDDSIADEAAFKAFTTSDVSTPLTGSNALPITSTPRREGSDEEMGAADQERERVF